MGKLLTFLLVIISAQAFCQLGGMSISPNGSPPDASAGLDINFTNKGLLIPRITQGQRDSISSPALGLTIFNITDNCYEGYGFGNWQTISCLCSGPPSTPGNILGNNNPCANSASVTYSTALVLGANTYTWTVPSDATIIAGQGTNSITVNFGVNPGNISVTANNSCGNSSADILPVTINTIPATPGSITGADTICPNSTNNIYSVASVAGATTYAWQLPSGTVTAGQGTNTATVSFGGTQGNMTITAGNVCGNSSASVLPIVFPNNHGTLTFNYTGGQQSFTVPACISSVTITAYGAQGGNGGTGGNGGSATGTLQVTPDTILYIYVGGQNGYNGGGLGGQASFNGGGESDVRMGGTSIANWVIVAGGGGGGSNNGGAGGAGGGGGACANGASGSGGTTGNGNPGIQGTCTDGGAAGNSSGGWSGGGGGGGLTSGGVGSGGGGYGNAGGTGTMGTGGNYGTNYGCGCCGTSGCGGGGGYYGGGGTSAAQCAEGCGGGGSSWALPTMTNLSFFGGVEVNNGQVVLNW